MGFFFSEKDDGSLTRGITTLPDGRRYSDPEYLIRTEEAKQHFKELKNLSVGPRSRQDQKNRPRLKTTR